MTVIADNLKNYSKKLYLVETSKDDPNGSMVEAGDTFPLGVDVCSLLCLTVQSSFFLCQTYLDEGKTNLRYSYQEDNSLFDDPQR